MSDPQRYADTSDLGTFTNLLDTWQVYWEKERSYRTNTAIRINSTLVVFDSVGKFVCFGK